MHRRFHDFMYILKHKIVMFKLWRKHDTKVSFYRIVIHDLEKMILCLIIGDTISSKIHRKIARHHNIKTYNDFCESYLDCASARYTKADKQLDAIETFRKYKCELYDKALEHYKLVNFK